MRRREVAGISSMQRGPLEGTILQADARAPLVGIDIFVHLIESQTDIQRQLAGEPDFVLSIDAEKPAELRSLVGKTIYWRLGCIVRENGGDAGCACLFRTHAEAGTQRVEGIEPIGAVALDAVEKAPALNI